MSNERAIRRQLHSRREFLGRAGVTVGGMAFASPFLAACGSDTKSSGTGGVTQDTKNLYFANWPSYIDTATVGLFEKATGISMKYTEEINDNDELFAKIKPLLSKGKKIDQDLITPTFWMASRLIKLGWLDTLPLDKIPNAKNLRPDLRKPSWDPTGQFSLPWESGFAGIAYNKSVTGRDLTKIDDLWDPKFKGKVAMLTEKRDTLGLIALSEGKDITKPTAKMFDEAMNLLDTNVKSGQIGKFTGNDYISDLAQGNLAACIGWSGDIFQLSKDNPNLKFVVPESGGTLWSDVMVIPKGSDGRDTAAEWMNYYYDPVNAARVVAGAPYYSPVVGVPDELRKLGGEAAAIADNPLVFPTAESLQLLHSFGVLSDADEETLDTEFSKVQGK